MRLIQKIRGWMNCVNLVRENYRLKCELSDMASSRAMNERYLLEVEQELRELQFAENNACAQLMQLRVHQSTVRQRTGFAVTAFIPEEVIQKLKKADRTHADDFTHVVAAELVSRAMHGLLHVNSRFKVSALIFHPASDPAQPMQISAAVFDSDEQRLKIHNPVKLPDERTYPPGLEYRGGGG